MHAMHAGARLRVLMFDWKRWIWPGVIATVFLTVLALWFRTGAIESDLAAKIAHAHGNGHWASVTIDGRDVTLSGTAPDADMQAEAVRLARQALGVRHVADRTGLARLADPYRFSAVKTAQGVTLSGHFPQPMAHEAVKEAAARIFPGLAVVDELALARGAPDGYTSQAEFAMIQLSRLVEGAATVTGGQLAVEGRAAGPVAWADLERDLAGVLPAGLQLHSMTVEPAPDASGSAVTPPSQGAGEQDREVE